MSSLNTNVWKRSDLLNLSCRPCSQCWSKQLQRAQGWASTEQLSSIWRLYWVQSSCTGVIVPTPSNGTHTEHQRFVIVFLELNVRTEVLIPWEGTNYYKCLHSQFGYSWTFIRIVYQKMKIMPLITHPCVVLNPEDLHSSSEHRLRYLFIKSKWQQCNYHVQGPERK